MPKISGGNKREIKSELEKEREKGGKEKKQYAIWYRQGERKPEIGRPY
jgi:hypothetical protein